VAGSIRLEIHEILAGTDDRIRCVVRCLEGTLTGGETLDTAVMADGSRVPVDLTVEGMERYGRPVDLLDPPHGAMLRVRTKGSWPAGEIAALEARG
jgi:hypothetical protein